MAAAHRAPSTKEYDCKADTVYSNFAHSRASWVIITGRADFSREERQVAAVDFCSHRLAAVRIVIGRTFMARCSGEPSERELKG